MSEEMKKEEATTKNKKMVVRKSGKTAGRPASPAASIPMNYNLNDLPGIFNLITDWKNSKIPEFQVQQIIAKAIQDLVASCEMQSYLILGLFDEFRGISGYHADKIYKRVKRRDLKSPQNICLLINSMGGAIAPAYLIGRTCQRCCGDKFIVTVPRKAKSAATLICLSADEIHMGIMSELGPVDPQIGGRSVLGLSNALVKIAETSAKYPPTTEMFARYLSREVDLIDFGHFERIAESAQQYADRLIQKRKTGKGIPKDLGRLTSYLVNHYKDHSFVIDLDESLDLLGSDIVKAETPEYDFANKVYEMLDQLDTVARVYLNKALVLAGDIESDIEFFDVPKDR